MEITGKVIVALPEMSGTSKSGNAWKKREYVLETINDNFPKKVHFDFFGDKADQYPLQVGQTIKLSFDIESREYQGRWYTSIRGWKADQVDASGAVVGEPQMPQAYNGIPEPLVPAAQPPVSPANISSSPEDDLPF